MNNQYFSLIIIKLLLESNIIFIPATNDTIKDFYV